MSLLGKLATLGRSLKKYVLSSEELTFISLNKDIWKDNPKGLNEKGTILVEGFLDSPTSIIEKSRIAKATQEVLNLKITVFVRGFYEASSNVVPIYRSFKIDNYIYWWRNYFNPLVVLPAMVHLINTLGRSGDELVEYKIDGLTVGDLIYDSLIRNIPNSYTIETLNLKNHGRLLFRSFCFYFANKRMVAKHNVKALVTSHNVYSEYGMLCRQVNRSGGVVLLKDMDVYKLYDSTDNVNEHFLKISKDKFLFQLKNSDMKKEHEYFKSRVLGLSSQVDVKNAYVDKREYSRQETLDLKGISSSENKNVFVMAHAFSDAPHVGEGLLFRDYYDFLEKTLIRLNTNESVNVFVKSHPSSYMWGEKGGVEEIVEKHNLDRITILPTDYNTSSILGSADYIVTAKGTAGIEFSCAGIPAVTAGKGYYYGFDVCEEPETIADYYKTLDNIADINQLDEHRVKKAHIILYHSFNNLFHSEILPKQQIRPGDDYQLLYRAKFQEVVVNIENGKEMRDNFYYKVICDLTR